MQFFLNPLWPLRTLALGIVLIILAVPCCKPVHKSELPPYVLDKETIEKVLTDVHLIEAALLRKQSQGLLAFDLAEIYYDSLFQKHGINKQNFDSTVAYYSRNPIELEEIYKNVITNLSRIEGEKDKREGMQDTMRID